MQKITPFLWFNDNAGAAMDFYVSVFENSKVVSVSRYTDAGPGPKGSIMVGRFELYGQEFLALNGGPQYQFNPAISFVVNCETQQEVDLLWGKLTAGGKTHGCGWVQDQFGVSWQIVPIMLGKLLQDEDTRKASRVMQAMFKMDKLDIAALQRAYESRDE